MIIIRTRIKKIKLENTKPLNTKPIGITKLMKKIFEY